MAGVTSLTFLTSIKMTPFLGRKKREQRGREEKEKEEISIKMEGEREEPLLVRIDRLRIRRGSVNLEDRKVGEPPAEIKIRDLDLDAKDIQIPIASGHSPIEFKGKLMGKTGEGDIYSKGWIDLKTMDMANFLGTRQVEVKIFEPYYRKRVSAGVDSGTINMDARIAVSTRGTISLTGILRA